MKQAPDVPDTAPSWCHLPDGSLMWLARPRWDGFGYEVVQYRTPSGRFIGSRMLATSIESARALMPAGLVVEASDPFGHGLHLYGYSREYLS